MRCYVDIETRATADLKKVGVYRYAECPDFAVLMMAWAVGDGPVTVVFGDDASAEILRELWAAGVEEFVAHNAQFERVCLGAVGAAVLPELWRDTMALAAEIGLPQSLDGAARAVGASEKDEAGKKLINLFCRPQRNGSWADGTTHPADWLDFITYCVQDVETLRDLDRRLPDWPPGERAAWVADQYVNDVGIRVDLALAAAAVAAGERNKVAAEETLQLVSTIDNPRSQPQMMKWAASEGITDLLPNFQADTIEAALEHVTDAQRLVLDLRADAALSASSKFATALAVANDDGKLRGQFAFFGAHTGRWAGRGVQLQNLPRESFADDVERDETLTAILMGADVTGRELKRAVRPSLVGPFTVVDFASIEARVIAWLAGEEWALAAFAEGRDIYVETALRMGLIPPGAEPGSQAFKDGRFKGKVAVLALGYQGALGSLRNLGAEGEDEELLELVRAWRKANHRIVALWGYLGESIEVSARVGKYLRSQRKGGRLALGLPSGRAIHYHGLRHERWVAVDKITGKRTPKEGWRYADPKEPRHKIQLYGGRAAENVTQAVARDLLAEAIIRLQAAGYRVAAHIHDEVIIEGEHDPGEIAAIMCAQPTWAPGLPIAAEGAVVDRYRKL